jgi:hypothetical protein
MDTTMTTDVNSIELSGAQVGQLVGLPAPKLATYVSNPDRWFSFFPDQQATGPGRYRYYSVADMLVVAMLMDTSTFTQTLATEFRKLLATEIRVAMSNRVRPETVSCTIERVTVQYQPRWDLLDTDFEQLFQQ